MMKRTLFYVVFMSVLLICVSSCETVPNVFNAPQGLVANSDVPGLVMLRWNAPETVVGETLSGYKIFRDGVALLDPESTEEHNIDLMVTSLHYIDYDVMLDCSYLYYVTAVYSKPKGESEPSNAVTVKTMESEEETVDPEA